MEFQLTELEKWEVSAYSVGTSIREIPLGEDRANLIFEYVFDIAHRVTLVDEELERNVLKCVSHVQSENLKNYYFERMTRAFNSYLKTLRLMGALGFIESPSEDEDRVNLENMSYKAENEMSSNDVEFLTLIFKTFQDRIDKMKPSSLFVQSTSDKNNGESEDETFEPLEFDNLSQKLLLLESLGVLKAISETTGEDISSRKMGRIIADILELKETTITRTLRGFNLYTQPKDKNNPRNKKNLYALYANLVKLELPILETEVEKQIKEVMSKED